MELRYVLKMLALPPGAFILLLLLAWVLRRRLPKTAGALFGVTLIAFWIIATPRFVEWGGRQFETDPPLATASWATLTQHADAIVVLGAGRRESDPGWGGDTAGIFSTERVRYASRIARASGLPILTTGGTVWEDSSHPSEADLMADVFEQDHGMKVTWREGKSRTTQENAELSYAILHPLQRDRVVLVTQAWHMPRARRLFEQQGFEVIAAPMGYLSAPNGRPLGGLLPEYNAFSNGVLLVHEWVGSQLYRYLPSVASSR